jgi:ribonuclease HII
LKVSRTLPTSERERSLHASGTGPVAGIDEAGRGALAGPVVAGAVVDTWDRNRDWHEAVRDSKQLSAAERSRLYEHIVSDCLSFGVGVVSSQDIDAIGIVAATRRAMYEAVAALSVSPGYILVDWVPLPRFGGRHESLQKGDCRCLSIACASIVAKVTRDRMMEEMDSSHPGYGFGRHKGYGTASHLRQLEALGASPIHRVSFRPVGLIVRGLI